MQKLNRIPYIVLIVILSVMLMIAFFITHFRLEDRKEEYYNSRISEYNAQIDSTLESYFRFSEYIYESVISEDEYILDLVNEAYTSDIAQQDIYRQDLYDYLIDEYDFIIEYDFRQLHFHFPDSTSFLRMHAPTKYGDSLYDVRYSIRTVNEYQRIETGFEEGRIFNGYRYVYPLTYNDEHIGSVEISTSLSSVINVLSGLYNSDYCFMISKDVVDSTLFDENLSNYMESFVSEDFYTDLACFADVSSRNLIPQAEFEAFFSNIPEHELVGLDSFEDFGLINEYQGVKYEVLFSSIENIEGSKVGYFISIQEEDGINEIISYFVNTNLVMTSIYLIFVISGVIFIKNRNLLKVLSNTDRLTNLDNRRKFEEDVNREIGRSKRTNIPLTFIMFDIDHFKNINDTFGHHIGDIVLRELATLISSMIRREDYFSRYGGEEFVMMLVGSNEIDAYNKAENLRTIVEQNKFSFDGNVKISLGVYENIIGEDTYDSIMKKVDKAMYEAKETGRNKTVKYSNIKTP